jgi:hypothetical protein
MVLVPSSDDGQERDATRYCLLGLDLALGFVLYKDAGCA